MPATCDSCGREEDDLSTVHRLYTTPGSWESPASVQRVEETERWCVACLSHYPHERLDD